MVRATLTVWFEGPFWVAVVERHDETSYAVARHVFGAEPSDAEILAWVRDGAPGLSYATRFAGDAPELRRRNPQRAQREARRALEAEGAGTRAMAAWKEALAERAVARRERRAREREEERAIRWALRAEKRKQKHRGR